MHTRKSEPQTGDWPTNHRAIRQAMNQARNEGLLTSTDIVVTTASEYHRICNLLGGMADAEYSGASDIYRTTFTTPPAGIGRRKRTEVNVLIKGTDYRMTKDYTDAIEEAQLQAGPAPQQAERSGTSTLYARGQ